MEDVAPSSLGWEIRQNAAATLARRGSDQVSWSVFREMVDLPRMTGAFLKSLLELCANGTGVVCKLENRYEPLAALYPVTCLPLAEKRLAAGSYALQEFVADAIVATVAFAGMPAPLTCMPTVMLAVVTRPEIVVLPCVVLPL